MRIINQSQHHQQNLSKCATMTENTESRTHGMNGAVTDPGDRRESGGVALRDTTKQPSPDHFNNLGGRLKFFKDGRFILELARAKEGEKVAWVPVPKKTFWPPQGYASATNYRQENSTSLSVSDDNSSVQSSPWQRDHVWKQSSPQRNASNHLCFCYYRRSKVQKQRKHICWLYRLQRSPLRIVDQTTKCNNNSSNSSGSGKCVKKRKTGAVRPALMHLVQQMWTKSLQTLNSITSPRKRILRELERVTIDDLSVNKRCRGKVNHVQKCMTSTGTASTTTVTECVNGTTGVKNSSYSITSLLGVKVENRNEKLSSSQFGSAPPTWVTTTTTHHLPIATSAAAAAAAHDTVDRRTTDLLISKRAPLTVTSSSSGSSLPNNHQYHYPPAHHSAPYMTGPYSLYSSGLSHHHHNHQQHSYVYYGAPSLYAAAAAAAASSSSSATAGLAHPIPKREHFPPWVVPPTSPPTYLYRDDTISDVPLNLSKHAD